MGGLETTTPSATRLPFIDALRGFALFGVFAANLMIFSGFAYMTDEQKKGVIHNFFDSVASPLELFLIENKFMGLFSFLFGISFWLFLNRARSRGGSATGLFYRRIGWLFVIGAAHGWLLWCFDILRFYAMWAVWLPLFVKVPLRRLLLIALLTAVVAPAVVAGVVGLGAAHGPATPDMDSLALDTFSAGDYVSVLSVNWQYDIYLTISIGQIGYQLSVFGRLLLGLYAARAFDLANLDLQRPVLKRILICGVIAGAVGNSIFSSSILSDANGFFLPFLRRFLIECGFLGFTLCFAAGLAMLFMNPRWTSLVRVLAPVGQMALTWYLLQTVLGIWLFYGFMHGPQLMGRISLSWLTVIAVFGFLLQVVIAHWWMHRFRFGPAEWLWRSLTYWKLQPLIADRRWPGSVPD